MPQFPLIAVIDDDESVRVSLEGLIRSLGHAVACFDSARAYLDSDAAGETACVISDVQMPGMTGIELKEALNASGVKTPVILMSAFADDAARARGERAGVSCFLSKPFSGAKLIECLERALAV